MKGKMPQPRIFKGTPERIALMHRIRRIAAENQARRIKERDNDPWYYHGWLFSKVAGDPEGCWNFTGHKDRSGYGKVKLRGRSYLAHRVAFKTVFGHLPDRLLVCHTCDNPSCINPQHLFLGTDRDNTMDALRKGRKFVPCKKINS